MSWKGLANRSQPVDAPQITATRTDASWVGLKPEYPWAEPSVLKAAAADDGSECRTSPAETQEAHRANCDTSCILRWLGCLLVDCSRQYCSLSPSQTGSTGHGGPGTVNAGYGPSRVSETVAASLRMDRPPLPARDSKPKGW